MEDIFNTPGQQIGKVPLPWLKIDSGISPEHNFDRLREKGCGFLCVSRTPKERIFLTI
jgi:hypothetical protein